MVKRGSGSSEVVTITEETIKDAPEKKGYASKKKTIKKTITKKSVKKKIIRKKRTKKKVLTSNRRETEKMEKILIENFISMQKVMANMAEKFDGLSKQLSKLLHLFENSAKALVEKEINLEFKGIDKQKELVDKLNIVLEQNKIIAKGLTLMHETAKIPGSCYSLNEGHQSNMPQKPINPVSFETSSIPSQQMSQSTSAKLGNQIPKMESGLMGAPIEPPSPNFGAQIKKSKELEEQPFKSPTFSSN